MHRHLPSAQRVLGVQHWRQLCKCGAARDVTLTWAGRWGAEQSNEQSKGNDMNLPNEIQKLVNQHVKEIERDIVQRIVESATRGRVRKPTQLKATKSKSSKPLGMLSNGAPKSNGTSKPAKVACQGKLPGGGICGSKTHGLSRHNQAMTMQAKYKKAKARVAHA